MSILPTLYRHSLALLTDLYELTMAYGYWKSGVAEQDAVFHLFFRENPFQGSFSIACGLGHVVELLQEFGFDAGDLNYLAGLCGNDGQPLFEPPFLDHLATMRLGCDVDAVPEGTVMFPHQPLVRVQGPILQCQILETMLLNVINFQTLIATKAARVCRAAGGAPVLEFGLRRAQGIDGGLAASRAAYVGGCAATSNVLAGKLFGIPVKGTHAHSWVMRFDEELEAFQAYAEAMPNNCVFLVDTYDTLQGVRNALAVSHGLRERGHEPVGIRLDSGDLAGLSIKARELLDAAGFPDAVIVASNELDEHLIDRLRQHGAVIDVWGVGTKLATAYDQPALGGVYKLSAVRGDDGNWQHKIKLSEQPIKVSNPGIQQVRRFREGDAMLADVIYNQSDTIEGDCTMIDLADGTRRVIPGGTAWADLLVPVVRDGQVIYQVPPLSRSREHCQQELARLPGPVKRIENPAPFPVGLEWKLHELKSSLIAQARYGQTM